MNYIELLNADLIKGYSKSDLEMLIGLPKNSLSGVIKGDKKLSKISQLKIQEWEASKKPSPLQVVEAKRQQALVKLKMTTPPNPNSVLIDIQEQVKVNNLPENKARIEAERNEVPKRVTLRVYPFEEKDAIPPMPKREDYADNMEYSFAKAEWKRKYNQ